MGVEPHASFVVGDDQSPSVVTVTAYTPAQIPLYRQPDKLPRPLLTDARMYAARDLADILRYYLLDALDNFKVSGATIADIDDPTQYYGREASDRTGTAVLVPTLFKFSHIRATAADSVNALQRIRGWESILPNVR